MQFNCKIEILKLYHIRYSSLILMYKISEFLVAHEMPNINKIQQTMIIRLDV